MPYLLSLLLLPFTISAYGADDKELATVTALVPESSTQNFIGKFLIVWRLSITAQKYKRRSVQRIPLFLYRAS